MFRAEENAIDFSCGVTDVTCSVAEWTANALNGIVNWMAEGLLGGSSGLPSALETAAFEEAGTWLGLAVMVMFITSVVGIATGAVLQRPDLIRRALFGTLLSFPATMFAFFVVHQALRVVKEVSTGLIKRLTGDDGFATWLSTAFELESGSQTDGTLSDWLLTVGNMITGGTISASASVSVIAKALIILLLFALGLFFVMAALAFRDFAIMLLIAFAPLAFVLLPAKGGAVWVQRWVGAVTAMILAEPLIFGTISLLMAGYDNLDTVWSTAGLTLSIGLFIAAFMPILAYSFFGFLGAGVGGDQVGSQVATSATRSGQRAGSMIMSRGRQVFNRPGAGVVGASAAGRSPAASAPAGASGAGKGKSAGTTQSGGQQKTATTKGEVSGAKPVATPPQAPRPQSAQPSQPPRSPSPPPSPPRPQSPSQPRNPGTAPGAKGERK